MTSSSRKDTAPTGARQDVRAFWNSRGELGQRAGTADVGAKRLEIEAIANYVRDGMRVLDVGCGNGVTAIDLASRYRVEVTGMDFAEEMVAAAIDMAAGQPLKGSVTFQVGDLETFPEFSDKFDLIYTERALINLADWTAQRKAIISIGNRLRGGGLYVMCENSQDGLDKINVLREQVGLSTITPPWHNRYIRDAEVGEASLPGLELEDIVYYSSTYYFLSRVVNAWLAQQEGKEPEYDAPINQLALQLDSFGDLGQGRIWLWRNVERQPQT